ncbi:Zinc finger, CCHC-type [Senna tora]|uniref:Zinc finger, CCHC-type n=1 Tax=Senna tora TaxID=362788 RepID=A0A834XD01_9FABA|nr:Zinc finger, CCHC-type [Senna tora]
MASLQENQDIVMLGQEENTRSQAPPQTAMNQPTSIPGWPPIPPLDKGGTYDTSFRGKLLGPKRKIANIPKNLIEKELVKIEYHEGNQALPKILIDEEIINELCVAWENTVIIKLLGKNVGFKFLNTKLRALWKVKGDFEIIDVGRGYFQVIFSLEEDVAMILEGGPWVILDHYLIIRRWEPEFHPETNTIEKTLAWVRFPELNMATRGRFARVCIEIDLKKALIGKIWIRGHWVKVEYESLHSLCSLCGVYGHVSRDCPEKKEVAHEIVNVSGENEEPNPIVAKEIPIVNPRKGLAENPKEIELRGDWMTVNKRRPNRRPTGAGRGNNGFRSINTFQALSEENLRELGELGYYKKAPQQNTMNNHQVNPNMGKKKRSRIDTEGKEVNEAPLDTNLNNPSSLALVLQEAFKEGTGGMQRPPIRASSPLISNQVTPTVSSSSSEGKQTSPPQGSFVPNTFPIDPGPVVKLTGHQGSRPPDIVNAKSQEGRTGSYSETQGVTGQNTLQNKGRIKPFDICGDDDDSDDQDTIPMDSSMQE